MNFLFCNSGADVRPGHSNRQTELRSCFNLLSGREKLLHQTFFVGLERFELLGLGGDQIVEGGQAGGDLLLFGISGELIGKSTTFEA